MSEFNTGAAPKGILSRALTGNIFVEKNLAFMNEGDRDGYNCYKHDMETELRARSANPSSVSSTGAQKKDYKRNLTIVEDYKEFDPADYHNYWRQYQPTGVFQWEGLPIEIQYKLEELFLGSAAEKTEDLLLNGDGTLLTGLVPQLKDATLVSLDGATPTPTQVVNNSHIAYRVHGGSTVPAVALTSKNIFEKFEDLIAHQTPSMRKRPGKKFMVSNKTADIFRKAQRLELAFKGIGITDAGIMTYGGYEVIECSNFPDDTILFASMTGDMNTDAFQLGTSMSDDFNNVEVNKVSNFGRTWGMCLTFALDIFLVRPEEVCFYTTDTIV